MTQITPELIKEVHKHSDVIVSESELMAAFDRLALALTDDFSESNPIFVCCMNGGLFSTSEVLKRLSFPLQIDYVHATRYRKNKDGSINWIKTPNINPEGRVVILVDDILDGGVTLAEVKKYYQNKKVKAVKTLVTLDKRAPREASGLEKCDYKGLSIENRYVYGLGLDYHGYLRNIPAIHAVHPKHMI